MATALACAGKSIGEGGRQRRSARRPEAGAVRKQIKNTGPRPYAIREAGRANRAIGRSAIARGVRCAPRARAGTSHVARARVTVDGHGASRPGSARALARRAIQARETYRGHDESTALGGLAHLHSLEVGSAAGAGAGGGGPGDDARGHRGSNDSGHFFGVLRGCTGACEYAGARREPGISC